MVSIRRKVSNKLTIDINHTSLYLQNKVIYYRGGKTITYTENLRIYSLSIQTSQIIYTLCTIKADIFSLYVLPCLKKTDFLVEILFLRYILYKLQYWY